MRIVIPLLACLAVAGCRAPSSAPPRTEVDEPQRYYPGWIGLLSAQIDAVRTCVQDRAAPTLVFHVSERPSGATGVLSVDGMGVVQRCAARDGAVVHRGTYEIQPEQLVGQPVFVLGQEAPVVGINIALEAVQAGDGVVGWLYWPRTVSVASGQQHEQGGSDDRFQE